MGENYPEKYDPNAGPHSTRHDALVTHMTHTFKSFDDRLARIERAISAILGIINIQPPPDDDQEAP